MKIILSSEAQDDLAHLPDSMSTRIADKLSWYGMQDDPLHFAESLQGNRKGFYRFRVGVYRIVFTVEKSHMVIMVVAVKHRGKVYR